MKTLPPIAAVHAILVCRLVRSLRICSCRDRSAEEHFVTLDVTVATDMWAVQNDFFSSL